ncbi:MAG: 3-oxoacyl-ACP synthase III [Brevibacterium aurantiacum]|uniref:3-oxoacyl-ACP synthase III n=1 Tax=Brevibacterium aurantiacum TaxID=273384 RepID=A0A1D7W8I6_BREAU|nr:3-oxoacyl-ACP synthase III [Brevibacterium aurantiacum]AOP55311.1 3-oxoacyl-[ACP] synthase III in alkane synthesis cluster [Brevibacterium aurantiacum]AZL10797.1 3-oxoacyl-ACP synthase III [Brevibacterium aurantiacum]PCC17996.1 3-oxoacyl-ACP synthase III [Brevibacterium aurantiacum]RCS85442.1 3-oxoacyl-ACP synthase III [Brevibacterium aurantiacum]RCS99617.1 3-oxoacyl-ACP synthase III [Brevibacterium aurantiacum]
MANGNATFRHSNVALLGLTEILAPNEVTSQEFDDRLADTLSMLNLPTGLLQRVAGVYARRNWDQPNQFADGAIAAGKKALAEAGVSPDSIGLMVNTSVTREHLEPSVAVGVHAGIGLGSQAMNFDIANACLGFVNGMTLAANMIDAGQIEYALVVAGEDASRVQEATLARLTRPGISREEYLNEFASLTLGSGASAAVLGPADKHPEGHRILGGITRAATQHHELCVGDHNGMFTDTKGLLAGGMELVVAAWEEAHEDGWNWREMDRYVMHQVSDVHVNSITKAANLDPDRIPVTYPELGNVGPASLPITLSREASHLKPGDRILCMGVGSGLNTAMTEIEW